MAQSVNGVLYVEYFTATGNPGEYTFENGIFNNQNDSTGEGAYLIDTSFVVFTPVVDINTFMPIAGNVSRYKFTSVTVIDNVRVSGTILYDEEGTEVGVPGNGVFCLVSKVTPNRRLAVPPLDDIYTDLVKGGTVAAMLNDLINILDKTSSAGTPEPVRPPLILAVTNTGQTQFPLPFLVTNKESSLLLVNGVVYTYGGSNDYTIIDYNLVWNNTAVVLEPTDHVVLR